MPIEERFWNKVAKGSPDECWLWTGAQKGLGYTEGLGYGTMTRGGRKGGLVGAHRVSWEIHNGPIPDGLFVLHRCDNPPCVNPSHLFLGSNSDNIKDAWRKREARGTAAHTARLTIEDVRAIRRRLTTGVLQTVIAAEFGVAPSVICNIKKGKAWGWLA